MPLKMMMKPIACLFFLPFGLHAQTSTDSLEKIWQNEKIADSVRFRSMEEQYSQNGDQLDKNLSLTAYHFKLAQQKKSDDQKLIALHQKAKILYLKGDSEKAKKVSTLELGLAKAINDPSSLFQAHLMAGSILLDERNFHGAIKHFNSGFKVCKENGLLKGEISCLNNLGSAYHLIRNEDLAIQCLEEAEKLSLKTGDMRKIGLIWLNIGTSKLAQNKFNAALRYHKKALKFFEKENNLYHQSSCYFMMASAYHKLHNDEKAIFYLEKSLKIDETIDNELRIFEGRTLLGKITIKSDAKQATRIGLDVLKKLNPDTPQDIRKGVYELLYASYKKLGDYQNSLEMYELFTASADSMHIEESNFATIREAVKHEFEVELFETKLKDEKARAALKIAQVKKNYLIISIAVGLILMILLFFRVKNVKMLKRRDELLKELNELKSTKNTNLVVNTNSFALDRDKIENSINRKLNETDWKVLQLLFDDPVITNKEIAVKAFMSEDGIGSSLRRMYEYFNVQETKYKKIALLMDAIKRSRGE